ncbi:MAG TPA: hypothetical protein VK562_08685, partial [Candidatus Acidoferrum sp.]|nr:hypothetical protein [Candidatus Acidoferrum sp.]
RAELVPDLLVNGIDDFLAGKHGESLPRITRMQISDALIRLAAKTIAIRPRLTVYWPASSTSHSPFD